MFVHVILTYVGGGGRREALSE